MKTVFTVYLLLSFGSYYFNCEKNEEKLNSNLYAEDECTLIF